MPSLSLLALLTALPCAEREGLARRLEETALRQPEQLPAAVEALARQWGGLPAPPPDPGAAPTARARQVASYLEQACALQAAPEPTVSNANTSGAERLQDILNRPEFARARERNGDVLKRLLRELQAWLENLFESRSAQGFAVATRAVMLGIALAVVLFGLLRWRRLGPRNRAVNTDAWGDDAPGKLDPPPEHLGRARAALARGDGREAIREALFCLLSALEQRGWARPDRVKTNRELAAELPGRGASVGLTREVEQLLGWYDRAFYSLAPVTAKEATRFVDDIERLRGTLSQGTP
ncbi:DUF4129 domain-containing protein [Corallococcus sp. M34]|uniref:DUF4129 domain-containing protein n=1 Tax=Citreicoccus inhibens TaxID=2849499 RepID=UPI001C248E97|nr:DUF4129 domain-containing protein [Citreicoccus inhibens]MBU8900186.1 DUF4129 domain-containing protein [Citreicoccus inhibens]